MGKWDLMVTSRFHGMIAGLSMGVPTLVIGWSHKYGEVLKMFELENLAFDYKNMTDKSLQSAFGNMYKNESAIHQKIAKNLPAVKKLAIKHIYIIDKAIET